MGLDIALCYKETEESVASIVVLSVECCRGKDVLFRRCTIFPASDILGHRTWVIDTKNRQKMGREDRQAAVAMFCNGDAEGRFQMK